MFKDGGPAFPCGNTPSEADGMTLRDYFAAAALSGILYNQTKGFELAADESYKYADAMLAEREKTWRGITDHE